jgi:hypothetical protein
VIALIVIIVVALTLLAAIPLGMLIERDGEQRRRIRVLRAHRAEPRWLRSRR